VLDAGIVQNAMDIVFVYLHIQQQSKLKTGFVIGENTVYLRYEIRRNGQRDSPGSTFFLVKHQE
jgi:hypothetical protein